MGAVRVKVMMRNQFMRSFESGRFHLQLLYTLMRVADDVTI